MGPKSILSARPWKVRLTLRCTAWSNSNHVGCFASFGLGRARNTLYMIAHENRSTRLAGGHFALHSLAASALKAKGFKHVRLSVFKSLETREDQAVLYLGPCCVLHRSRRLPRDYCAENKQLSVPAGAMFYEHIATLNFLPHRHDNCREQRHAAGQTPGLVYMSRGRRRQGENLLPDESRIRPPCSSGDLKYTLGIRQREADW